MFVSQAVLRRDAFRLVVYSYQLEVPVSVNDAASNRFAQQRNNDADVSFLFQTFCDNLLFFGTGTLK